MSRPEFISLLALSMALSALGIDIMLPALGSIRAELGLAADSTAVAGLVTAYMIGLAAGQITYGVLSDHFGRRPVFYAGYAIYIVGALAATLSASLTLLLVSRFIWGLGAAGPRVLAMAAIRDTYHGDQMARAMSFVMAVFIIVPIIAPLLGAAIVTVGSWRWVFAACAILAAALALWATRLPETLSEANRRDLRPSRIWAAARFAVSDRLAVCYTLAMASVMGAFFSYLASSEIIVGDAFGRPAQFPFVFAGLAVVMGSAMLVNARVVARIGGPRVSHVVLLAYVVLASVLAVSSRLLDHGPSFAMFVVGTAGLLATHAVLIPNFTAAAMTNMAPVAGMASSIIGTTQIALGASLGAVIDQAYEGSVVPLWSGFAVLGWCALGLVLLAEGGRLFRPRQRDPGPGPDPPATRDTR